MAYSSFITWLIILFFVPYINTQQCDQPSKAARFNCYPEGNPTEKKCTDRQCCWLPSLKQSNLSVFNDPDVPPCYYPSDFPTYEVTSNEQTDFGQQIRLYKSRLTYLQHNINNLTVDLRFETQQRLRIRIYDPEFERYEVPLQVPKVDKKADTTDYEVQVVTKPFAIVVTRKSTNEIL